MTFTDINSPLVETKRPPFLNTFKYAGRKPHNIWGEYIKTYTNEGDIVFDPFVGSGTAAFEAVRNNRKAIAFDLNPISSFLIEVLCSDFEEDKFKKKVFEICEKLSKDETYKKYFSVLNPKTNKIEIAHNFKWENDQIYEVGIKCFCINPSESCNREDCRAIFGSSNLKRVIKSSNNDDVTQYQKYMSDKHTILYDELRSEHEIINDMASMELPYWYPDNKFPDELNVSKQVLNSTKGLFYKIWTERVIYANSFIFNEIKNVNEPNLQQQLLYGFIGSVHLTSKMCIPRNPASRRPFACSWGRNAILIDKRKFEQNPLFTFWSACVQKQSVVSALRDSKNYLGKKPVLKYVDTSNKSDRSMNFDIKYGIINSLNLKDYIDKESVDFVITDPPYEDLVPYLDLSYIWCNWLVGIDKRMKVDFQSEITIKKNLITENIYKSRLEKSLENIKSVLKKESKMVLTFHNKKVSAWINILTSLRNSGFSIEKSIYQPNLRSGEASVANPYGTAASDFYLRCGDKVDEVEVINNENIEEFIKNQVIKILSSKREPTPLVLVRDGFIQSLPYINLEISSSNESINNLFEKVLQENKSEFIIDESKESKHVAKYSTDLLWFKNPEKYLTDLDVNLTTYIDETVSKFMQNKVSATFDEVMGEVFSQELFLNENNILVPNTYPIKTSLEKYAIKSGDNWIFNEIIYGDEFTQHSEKIVQLVKIGQSLGFKTFIGKREQSDLYDGKKLIEFSDYADIEFLNLEKNIYDRAKFIDVIWFENSNINSLFEVESTTNFTSAIQRGSNLKNVKNKYMLLPDNRESNLLNTKDPYFVDGFKNYEWKYFLYSDLETVLDKPYDLNKVFKVLN